MSGEVQPDYGKVYSLAYAIWPRQPGLARELVEASGYAWSEPSEVLPDPDVIAGELGEETAERLRRVLRERGAAGEAVLAEIERAFRPPASDPPGPEQSRAAG